MASVKEKQILLVNVPPAPNAIEIANLIKKKFTTSYLKYLMFAMVVHKGQLVYYAKNI